MTTKDLLKKFQTKKTWAEQPQDSECAGSDPEAPEPWSAR